jgi:hypothetical protein
MTPRTVPRTAPRSSLNRRVEVLKSIGNNLFKEEQFDAAAHAYTDAIKVVTAGSANGDANKLQEVHHACLLNRAACFLKCENFTNAVADCDTVLKADPMNVKALFRKGQAQVGRAMESVGKPQVRWPPSSPCAVVSQGAFV